MPPTTRRSTRKCTSNKKYSSNDFVITGLGRKHNSKSKSNPPPTKTQPPPSPDKVKKDDVSVHKPPSSPSSIREGVSFLKAASKSVPVNDTASSVNNNKSIIIDTDTTTLESNTNTKPSSSPTKVKNKCTATEGDVSSTASNISFVNNNDGGGVKNNNNTIKDKDPLQSDTDNDNLPTTNSNSNTTPVIITSEMVDKDNVDNESKWDKNVMSAVMMSLSNQESNINDTSNTLTTLTYPGIITMQTMAPKLVSGCEEEVDQMLIPFKNDNSKSKTWHFLVSHKFGSNYSYIVVSHPSEERNGKGTVRYYYADGWNGTTIGWSERQIGYFKDLVLTSSCNLSPDKYDIKGTKLKVDDGWCNKFGPGAIF